MERRGRPIVWAPLFGLVAASAVALLWACSAIVDTDAVQCRTDGDCARFQGTVCRSGGCVAPPSPAEDAAADGGSIACSSTQDCLAFVEPSAFSICRKRDHTCVNLLSHDCGTVLGSYKSDDAIFLGALVPSLGPDTSTGLSLIGAMRLASGDFARGLPPTRGLARRPLVFVVCDESREPARAARHLVDDLDVPAILGATLTDDTRRVASEVASDAGVLLLSPTASGSLADAGSPDLVRRTCPPAALEADAMSLVVSQILEPRVAAQRPGNVRVAVVHKGDTYGGDLDAEVRARLVLNGKPVDNQANQGWFIDADYGDPDVNPDPGPDYAAAVTQLTNGAALPDVVMVLGNTEAATNVIKAVEERWPGATRPYYVGSSGLEVPELLALLDADDALRARMLVTAAGADPNDARRALFEVRYSAAFGDGISTHAPTVDVFGTAHAFDAFYTLALAAGSLGGDAVTGRALAARLGNLAVAGAAPIDVGPAALEGDGGADDSVFGAVADGGVDLRGASGPLDWDPATGDPTSEVRVLCARRKDAGKPPSWVDSGQWLDPTTLTLAGAFDPQCLQ